MAKRTLKAAQPGRGKAQEVANEEPEIDGAEFDISTDEEQSVSDADDLSLSSGDLDSDDGDAAGPSSSDGDDEAEEGEDEEGAEDDDDDKDIREAIMDYMKASSSKGEGEVRLRRARLLGGGSSRKDKKQQEEEEEGPSGGEDEGDQKEGASGDDDAAADRDGGAEAAPSGRELADLDDDGAEDEDAEPRPVDPGSDSSEDERPNRNTVGAVPMVWYKDEDHIGYDLAGRKLGKKERKDKLEQLLDRNDSAQALRTVYDEYNDEEIVLSKEELRMIMRIRKGQFPHVEINPYEPYNDYFSSKVMKQPINDAPVPKSRFVPSKWEEKKIVKLVRAIRKGWLKTSEQLAAPKEEAPPVYMLWNDDGLADDTAKTGAGLTYIPAPKLKLPGHEESYNPSAEYLPTEEELSALAMSDEKPGLVPKAFASLRQVPAYDRFIHERFERCLDLYLCPRIRRKRLALSEKDSLVPQLPKPRDLQPFPNGLALVFRGHVGKVLSVAPDPSGQWLLSGGQDGTVRLWEVRTGRCMRTWALGSSSSSSTAADAAPAAASLPSSSSGTQPVVCVAWCPRSDLSLWSACVGNRLLLLSSGLAGEEVEGATAQALQAHASSAGAEDAPAPLAQGELVRWQARKDGGLELVHRFPLRHVSWHARGDYFVSVAPTGNTQAVVVHQLSRGSSQNPFRKNRGRVARVLFHPSKPFMLVATQNHVRIYNLAKQALAKKLIGGSGVISCMALHPSGDHVLLGSDDKRLAWYDLDLSDKPYKALRYHTAPLRGVAYHRAYPLFASASDDGSCQVFHGMVYADLLTNPLIVPVKILRGHKIVDHEGVLDCAFHPTQPWVFTAGADANIHLYCNL